MVDQEQSNVYMSDNMGPSLKEFLEKDSANAGQADDQGWTMLHQQALAGSASGVAILLEHGADRNAVTKPGMTPLQLANSLGWTKVAKLLTS